jgi:hypothetical protein
MAKFNLAIYPAKDYKIWFAGIPYNQYPKKPKSVQQWAKDEGADICYNLAWFNMKHGKLPDGNDYYGGTTQDVVGKGIRIGYGGNDKDYLKIDDNNYCNGYKTAIKNGKIQSGVSKSGRTSRNCNGWTKDGYYFHLQVDSATEYECAEYMYKQGATLMLMQDGGGSTCKVENGKVVFIPDGGRAVSSVVCIKKLNTNSKVTTPTTNTSTTRYKVNTALLPLNIRNAPNGKVIGSLPKGKIIEVESISNGWAKFNFYGVYGYCSASYLKKV